MNIRIAEKKDCLAVVEIHFQEIKYGFLNQLGKKFLYYFYTTMINSENAFLIIAEDNGEIVGFASGAISLKKFYKEFVRKNFIKASFILLRKIFSFAKIFEVIKYSKKEDNTPKAELLTIAVSLKFQGSGVAQLILNRFILEMKKRDVTLFKALVGVELERANKFYQKSGFHLHSQDSIHKDKLANIYIYKIT